MVVTLFSAVLLFCMITGNAVFYPVGGAVQTFMLGFTGYFGYPLLLFLLLSGIMAIIGKKIVRGKGVTKAVALTAFLCSVFTIIQLATAGEIGDFYVYIQNCYRAAEGGVGSSTVGGVLFGLIAFVLKTCLSVYGAYILLSAIAALCLLVVFKELIFRRKNTAENSSVSGGNGGDTGAVDDNAGDSTIKNYRGEVRRRPLVVGDNRFELKSASDYSAMDARRRSDEILGSSGQTSYGTNPYGANNVYGGNGYVSGNYGGGSFANNSSGNSYGSTPTYGGNSYDNRDKPTDGNYGVYSEEYGKDRASANDYVKTPRRINPDGKLGDYDNAGYGTASDRNKFEEIDGGIDEPLPKDDIYIPENYKEAVRKSEPVSDRYSRDVNEDFGTDIEKEIETEIMNEANSSATDDEIVDVSSLGGVQEKPSAPKQRDKKAETSFTRRPEPVRPTPKRDEEETPKQPETDGEEVNPYDLMPLDFRYNPPPLDLFKTYKSVEDYGAIEYFKQEKATTIMNTLKVLGGVNVTVVNIVHGPTITRFDLAIPDDVSIKNIMKYADDLKLRLKTASEIRFATIPKTPYIGVEVPNDTKSTVGLRDVLESEVFVKAKPSSLTFAIGKNIVGDPVVADITKMPHLLIAGSTGTGKSVGLNSLLVSLMYKYSPADLRFIIVDPKQVEFTIFEGIPHMYFDEILCDAPKTVAMLNWAVKEMEDRYTKLKNAVVRNIDEYNDQIDPRRERRMPRIVIIIDEFADLMSVEKKNIEDKIARIAQKARAAGMYLILATQRPDVKIIEGSIKTNFTSRMAFKMSNAIDSTTILGEAGAEKLLGAGDLLYKTSTMTNVERAQGAFIGTDEIKNVVKYIKEHNKSYFNDAALKAISKESAPQVESYNGKESAGGGDAVPEDYIHALKVAVQLGTVSISLLQRKLSFGYPKAAKIVDWMTDEGYIVASQMGKQKQVTLSMDEFIEKFGDV